MGQRETNPELQALYDQNIPVYSFSKLETINNCLLAAYKTYIAKEKGTGNIYAYAGTKIHDVLEAIMNNEATEADLLPALQEELEDMEMLGIDFPLDKNGNPTLKNNWIADMEHFCKTYKRPNGRFDTEQFFIYKTTKGHYIQGYIDLIRYNPTGDSISIYDYKTSSMYSGEEIKKHGRQLLLYAMGKMQQGIPVKSVSWIYLKYVTVKFSAKKMAKSKQKTDMEKTIERRKIGSEMSKYVRTALIDAGYDEIDIESYIDKFIKTNKFDVLPPEIAVDYKIIPCVVSYDLTDENIEECEKYINDTIEMWESLSGKIKDYPHREFTKTQLNGKVVNDLFFCTALCNHKNCDEVVCFLEQQQNDDDNDSLF